MELAFKQEEEEEKVVPLFRPATGGGFAPTGGIWLDDLELGTVFLAQKKSQDDYFAHCFIINNRLDRVTQLIHQFGEHSAVELVIPARFVRQWMFIQVLDVLTPKKEEENGDSNTDSEGTMAGGEIDKVVDILHERKEPGLV